MALVSYVKKLNIPSGVVGACRLDLAYEHFKVLLTFSIKCCPLKVLCDEVVCLDIAMHADICP